MGAIRSHRGIKSHRGINKGKKKEKKKQLKGTSVRDVAGNRRRAGSSNLFAGGADPHPQSSKQILSGSSLTGTTKGGERWSSGSNEKRWRWIAAWSVGGRKG